MMGGVKVSRSTEANGCAGIDEDPFLTSEELAERWHTHARRRSAAPAPQRCATRSPHRPPRAVPAV